MLWLLALPGHQQHPCYRLCRICKCLSYVRKYFKYLCHMEERYELQIIMSVSDAHQWPLLLTWLPLISVWMSNYSHYKLWNEITHPFPNFNGYTVEVWEWISNFIQYFIAHVIHALSIDLDPVWKINHCWLLKGFTCMKVIHAYNQSIPCVLNVSTASDHVPETPVLKLPVCIQHPLGKLFWILAGTSLNTF